MKLDLVSYNILAPCYAHLHHRSREIEPYIGWDHRKHLILHKLQKLNPHVICLQEVEYKGFIFLESELRNRGYRGIFAMKGLGKMEGLAIFFQFEEWMFAGAETLFFHDYYPDRQTTIPLSSGDNALFVYLKTEKGLIGIVTTHIHAYFLEEDLVQKKTNQLQIQQIFDVYIQERTFVDHWIIAGDFNQENIPSIYLSKNHLLDAHQNHFYPTFEDRKIDYIFHSDTLKATPIHIHASPLPHPNDVEGSDHIPIGASFTNFPIR